MALEKHVKLVLSGAKALARWHSRNPNGVLELRRADFHKKHLNDIDLHGAELVWADFRWCDLVGADFSGADLSHADFHKADLQGVDLSGCDLTETNLEDALCDRASFHNATFKHTRMFGTNLTGALGLDQVKHAAHSILDDETLAKSTDLPISFVEGCGRTDAAIELSERGTLVAGATTQRIAAISAASGKTLRVDWCERAYAPDDVPSVHTDILPVAEIKRRFRNSKAAKQYVLRVDEPELALMAGKPPRNLWEGTSGQQMRMLAVILDMLRVGYVRYDTIYKKVFEETVDWTRFEWYRSRVKGKICRRLNCGLDDIIKAPRGKGRYERAGMIPYCWIRSPKKSLLWGSQESP